MKNNAYLGIDIGSISTKAVVIDEDKKIITSEYLWTEADPIGAVKRLLKSLSKKIDKKYEIVGIGTTGSARKLVGILLNACVIKNEITAHAVGTLNIHPNVKTILEIGGQDSKIIILEDKIITDYAMNTLCAAGTGAFLSSQAKRLNIDVNEFGRIALKSNNPTKIAARCTVFAESDLVHKAQMGYNKEDIIAGLCKSVVNNYLNNVGKGKKIKPPIVFQGGVSKNIGVVKAFEKELNEKILVDDFGHLMGAYGVAILAKDSNKIRSFSFEFSNSEFKTKGIECGKCPNNCEIVKVYRDGELIDSWGNRCENGIK